MTILFSRQVIRLIATATSLGGISLLVVLPTHAEVVQLNSKHTVSPSKATLVAQGGKPTLAEIAGSNRSFSILTQMLKHLGVDQELNDPNSIRYTIFAPTDDAFNQLPQETLETLLQPGNKDTLKKILAYHVIPGTVASSQLKTGNYRAATTEDLFLQLNVRQSGVQVNNAKVLKADIYASNGVIHVIDKVLIPAE